MAKKGKIDATIAAALIIGILAAVNFISYQFLSFRWDITQNNDYSISAASRKTAAELDDIVNIKVYFSNNLPSQFISLKQNVKDILDEYENYSGRKIKVESVDPEGDENLKSELYALGIPELQFEVYEKDQLQLVKGYLGMAVEYGGKTEIIPVVKGTEDLEYQITMAIKKVTSDEMAVIGILISNSSIALKDEAKTAYDELSRLYTIKEVDLAGEDEIPAEITALVIPGPAEKLTADELKKIDSFVIKGGSLLVLADGVMVGEGLSASAFDSGLNDLLAGYGLKIKNNLVLDNSAGMASFNSGFMTFTLKYPLWPKIAKDGFSSDSAAVANLESVVLPWASSVEIIKDKIPEGNKIIELAKTSANSWEQADNYNLNPQGNFAASSGRGAKTMAVMESGRLKSPYSGASTDNGRLIVVGDSDFIKDKIAPANSDNLVFFQNLVDILSLDEDLINIRSKGVSDRPIRELSDSAKAVIRYLNIFGITLLVIVFGVSRYFLRKRERFTDEL